MSEQQYDDHDTQPIKLPRFRRETFKDLPPPVSPWSADAPKRNHASVFDIVHPTDPQGTRHFESLTIGDELHIPSPMLDDEGRVIPGSIYLSEYRVKSLQPSEDGLSALLVSSAGIDRIIPAKLAAKKHEIDFEVELNRSLAKISGVDIHDATELIVEDTPED